MPLPPKRPASLPTETASAPAAVQPEAPASQPALVVTAAVQAPTAPAGPLTDRQIVERANAYFNSISSLVGDFTQVGADGRRLTGTLYLQRPGKLRFEYDSPATIDVIADGSAVAVRDRKLATQDIYPIGQTPLKFLVRERIDLSRDLRVMDVAAAADGATLTLEDKTTLGGTSRITLSFDKDVEKLTRWRILDPQGFTTTVSLANLDRNRRVDSRLFVINYERMHNDR